MLITAIPSFIKITMCKWRPWRFLSACRCLRRNTRRCFQTGRLLIAAITSFVKIITCSQRPSRRRCLSLYLNATPPTPIFLTAMLSDGRVLITPITSLAKIRCWWPCIHHNLGATTLGHREIKANFHLFTRDDGNFSPIRNSLVYRL